MSEILTTEEKIDYIYNDIKARKRWTIIKFIFKIAILIFIIVSVINFTKDLNKEELTEKLTDTITDITAPIVNDILQDLEIKNTEFQKEKIDDFLKNNKDFVNQLK